MSEETHLWVPSIKLLEVHLYLLAAFPFMRQQWEGGKEVSCTVSGNSLLLLMSMSPSLDEIFKLIGLGFSFFSHLKEINRITQPTS